MAKSQTVSPPPFSTPLLRTVHGKWVATEIQLANKIPFRTKAKHTQQTGNKQAAVK